MKHINTFEKQIPLFPDYNKEHSDSLKDVGMKYIDKFTSNIGGNKSHNKISNWSDAENFLRGKKFREDYLTSLTEALTDDNDVSMLVSENIEIFKFKSEIYKFVTELNITNKVELDRIKYTIENLEDGKTLEDLFEDLKDIKYILDLSDFIEWLKETNPYFFIENDFINTEYYYKLINWTDGEEHLIWRAIKIPDKINDLEIYLQKYNGVGECWAYDVNGAETHNGDSKVHNTIILRAVVNPEDIDWEYTLYLSLYSLSDEKEIRMKKGAVVEVEHLFIQNNNPNVVNLKNKDIEYYQKILGIDYNKASTMSKIGTYLDIELEDSIYVKV